MISTAEQGKNSRQTNLELFRIILMLAIIAHHYVVNSGVIEEINKNPSSLKSLLMLLFGAWGKTGINCFVLITGYFMCRSKITLTKFLKLLLEVEFYKICFYLIFLCSGYEKFSIKHFVKGVFPITSVAVNFVGCFLIFYLCIQFINVLIRNLTKLQHALLVVLSLFIYTILNTVGFHVAFNYVTWFIVLYFLASYIRFYPIKLYNNLRFWSIAFICSSAISCISVLFIVWVGKSEMSYLYISDSNKLLAVTTAVSAFMLFKNLPCPNISWINTIAQSTFGVLLIHANSDAMRKWLWRDMLNNSHWFNTQYFLIHAVTAVIVIYIICVLIDNLRIRFLERPLFQWWSQNGENRILCAAHALFSFVTK